MSLRGYHREETCAIALGDDDGGDQRFTGIIAGEILGFDEVFPGSLDLLHFILAHGVVLPGEVLASNAKKIEKIYYPSSTPSR